MSPFGIWLSTKAKPGSIIIFRKMIFFNNRNLRNVIFILLYQTFTPGSRFTLTEPYARPLLRMWYFFYYRPSQTNRTRTLCCACDICFTIALGKYITLRIMGISMRYNNVNCAYNIYNCGTSQIVTIFLLIVYAGTSMLVISIYVFI